MASPSATYLPGDASSHHSRTLRSYGDEVDESPDTGSNVKVHSASSKKPDYGGPEDTTKNTASSAPSSDMASENKNSEETQQPEGTAACPSASSPVADNYEDDGWDYYLDESKRVVFFNRLTGAWQYNNPRVPEDVGNAGYAATTAATDEVAASTEAEDPDLASIPRYDPKIHGSYDPKAPYAIHYQSGQERKKTPDEKNPDLETLKALVFEQQAQFNRATGSYQDASRDPSRHSDEAKAKRQMENYFDHDEWAAQHGGKSLKDERRQQKVTKKQVKQFKQQKEQKKRAKMLNFYLS